ncbi:MAG: hemolysin III family protein [Christensenellaceae bacterium]|nr:hemolysin III family protein [Christensenellaceae bacterium]
MSEQAKSKQHRITIPRYTLGEELTNSISHGIGAGLGIAALVLCIVKSAIAHDGYKLASSIVFGLTVTLLYLMSCLYHALKVNKAKRVFRVMDHCTIFLLIAGTYTPFTLVTLRGALGWSLFGIVWGVAILGIVLNAVNLKKYAKLSVLCYLGMGWVILFAFRRLADALNPVGLYLLIAGGIAYTVGAILYAIGSKRKYFHSVFHFFCVIGTVLHFFAIYLYVL